MAKKSLSKSVVTIPDITFATLIHKEMAVITVSQGIVCLASQSTGMLYTLPPGLSLPPEASGQVCEIIVRDISHEVLLKPGPDDVYEEQLFDRSREKVMPVDQWRELLTLMDERKLKDVTKGFSALGTLLSGCILSGVSYWLLTTDFKFRAITIGCLVLGVLSAVFGGVFTAIKYLRHSDAVIIRDSEGKYINTISGRSNLNGGMFIPVDEK